MISKKFLITLILFVLLLYTRIEVRLINAVWADEWKEINSLKSIYYLITGFLPTIPGGAPGDYLMLLPFKKLFGVNKVILGVPGLVANILVYILIPYAITKLEIIKNRYNYAASTITRVFFVFDPNLTFQAMQIRPYANLPFYWIVNLFVVLLLVKTDHKKQSVGKAIFKIILIGYSLGILFIWHYYTIVMLLSIYLFFLFKSDYKNAFRFYKLKSFYSICVGVLFAAPFWLYFASQTGKYPYYTFNWLKMSLEQIYAIDKGGQKGLVWQNWIYFFLLIFIIALMTKSIALFIWKKDKIFFKDSLFNFLQINLFLVALPLFVILLLDVLTSYMLLYRQFVWITLPFYIAVSILITGMLIK